MTSIADLRKSYERSELNENASNADPLGQFQQWLTTTRGWKVNQWTKINIQYTPKTTAMIAQEILTPLAELSPDTLTRSKYF